MDTGTAFTTANGTLCLAVHRRQHRLQVACTTHCICCLPPVINGDSPCRAATSAFTPDITSAQAPVNARACVGSALSRCCGALMPARSPWIMTPLCSCRYCSSRRLNARSIVLLASQVMLLL